jgi:hypothetical protein
LVAVLQILFQIRPLADYIRSGQHREETRGLGNSKFTLTEEFEILMKQVYESTDRGGNTKLDTQRFKKLFTQKAWDVKFPFS